MRTIAGDLLEREMGVLVQQVNARGAMGAGLALRVRRRFPEVYREYREAHAEGRLVLGHVLFTRVGDELWVASVVGQAGYGRRGTHTDYGALARGLAAVCRMAGMAELPVWAPYGLGCGLGGGDWPAVESLIEEHCPAAVVVRLTE